ncbi:MAG TPA: hypothetical protein VEH79_01205 [Gaiellaceae bacterium]|nr:hypothetical protein [Gaiellaceae bacterium]
MSTLGRTRFLLAAGLALLAASAGSAGATDECQGLQTCVPVAGPWVVVPTAAGTTRPQVEYQLACPKGFVVGGTDVEVSDREIDVVFLGRSGSPVNPGVTTSRAIVFVASYVGGKPAGPSFRPHIGCLPAAGGGGRVPTALTPFTLGQPTVRRVRQVRLAPGARTVVQGCARDERLVGGWSAVGFYQPTPPPPALAAAVSSVRGTRGGRVVARVESGPVVSGVRAVLQIGAVCAGGT